MKTILVQQMTGDDQGARQRGHDGETGGHQRRHMHRRFGNAHHRPLRQLARRQQPGVAKTGDHVPVYPLLATGFDLLQHAHSGDGFIKVALYRWDAFAGADRQNLGSRRGDRPRGGADGFRHCQAGVGIDHLYTNSGHYGSL